MSKVFLIIGKSLSGKDTLLNRLLSDKEFCESNGLTKTVRYTTRPIRPNEVDGEDYHFISNETYDNDYKYNADVVTSSFNTISYGKVHYITDLGNLDPNKNYIGTGDIDLINGYKMILDKDLCVIVLLPPDWLLFKRFGERKDSRESVWEQYREIHRRYMDELKTFGRLNTELANVSCIISEEKEPDLVEMKEYIRRFINGDTRSVIISDTQDNAVFDNEYENDRYFKDTAHCSSVCKGDIILHNGLITIHNNDGTYEINL